MANLLSSCVVERLLRSATGHIDCENASEVMATRTIYCEPGDLIRIRVCAPEYDETASATAWKDHGQQRQILAEVIGMADGLAVPFGIDTYTVIGTQRKQRL